MKTTQSNHHHHHFKHLALALALGTAFAVGNARAQVVLDVAGTGVIGDEALTTAAGVATLSTFVGANWTVEGSAAGGGNTAESFLISPGIVVPSSGTVTLKFNHRYFFEDNFDGGAVFVSVNGAPATYVPAAAFSANGYVSAMTGGGTAWTGGEQVFHQKSAGYDTPALIQSVADLGTYTAGDTLVVEFRAIWDEGFIEPGADWEIGTVTLEDSASTPFLAADFTAEGPSGFTVTNNANVSDPWNYPKALHTFEINADTLAADRYAPDITPATIDLNNANLAVEVLTGTLTAGDSFTLFDLSGGATLTGTYDTVTLPGGKWDLSGLATTGTIICLVPPSLVEESFDYAAGNINGKDGGTGFTGPWSATKNSPTAAAPDKLWGALGTAGNHARGNAWSGLIRPIGTTLADKGLLDDGATLWFSIIIDLEAQNFSNADLNLALCNATKFESGDFGNRENLIPATAEGIGVTHSGGGIQGVYWQDSGDADGFSERNELSSSLSLTGANPRALIVGRIDWGATPTDPETLTLYAPDLDLNLGTEILAATATLPMDQTAFDSIAIQFKDTPQIDEIRFGPTSSDVLPPDVTAPALVSTDPANNEPNASGVFFQATFNEPVFIGTGDIRIIDTSGPTTLATIPVTDAGQVSFNADGFSLEIQPTILPTAGNTYYIEMDAGTVEDFSGNPFAGISDPATWSYTVSDTAPTVVSIDGTPAASPVFGTPMIRYTVSFDKFYMDDATVNAIDFVNVGTAAISVGTITRISDPLEPAVYTVDVTTGSAGTVELQVATGIADVLGNALAAAVTDNDIYTLDAGPESAKGTISVENYAEGSGIGGAGDKTLVTGFDASGADKLVVVVGAEHGFSLNTGGRFNSMTYGGAEMTLVIQEEAGIPTAAIFYLDDPAATGNIVVNQDNHNGTIFGVYALSGTVPGVGAANKSTANGVELITATSNSLVIAGVLNAGSNGANGATNMIADPPLTEDTLSDLISGTRWVSMSFGSGIIASPSFATYSFSGANATDLLASVAVEIQAAEPTLSDYGVWAATFAPADLTDPNADFDGDGLSNDHERLFGLAPNDPASVNPIAVPLDATAGTFSFTRRDDALTGKFSNVETSTDLAMWTKDSGALLTPGTPDGNQVETVAVTLSPGLLSAPKLFVRIVQDDGVVFSANFEDDNGGFTVTGAPNDWAWGAPNSDNAFGLVLTGGNGGSTNCWATNLGTGGTPPSGVITAAADSILRSPDISLADTALVELQFAAAVDAAAGDRVEVLVREVGSGTLLATVLPLSMSPLDAQLTADWTSYGPYDISAAAGSNVYLEFRFLGGNAEYIGVYIDDVTVRKTNP